MEKAVLRYYNNIEVLLCKRSSDISGLTLGKSYKVLPYYDGKGLRHFDCFWVIDDHHRQHCFFWSEDPEAPRSYSKWFYSISESREIKINQIL